MMNGLENDIKYAVKTRIAIAVICVGSMRIALADQDLHE